jgi:sirohydrochlorin ferrochelatase
MKTAFILFAHGSSVESANAAVRAVAQSLAGSEGLESVQAAFLEQGRPNLEEAVATVAGLGASRIAVVPYFLTLGLHMQRDLPRIIERLSSLYPGIEFCVTPPLDGHPALITALRDRVASAFL